MKAGSLLAFCCILQQTREETRGKVNGCFSVRLLLMHILDTMETLEHRRRHGERESERRKLIKGGNGEKNHETQALSTGMRVFLQLFLSCLAF